MVKYPSFCCHFDPAGPLYIFASVCTCSQLLLNPNIFYMRSAASLIFGGKCQLSLIELSQYTSAGVFIQQLMFI